MKNNLHTELREAIEKILQGDLEETRINQLVDLFSDFSLSTSPDAIVKQDTLEELIEEVRKYPEKVFELYGGKMPWVYFEGKADEDEKRTIYQMAFNDVINLLKRKLNK